MSALKTFLKSKSYGPKIDFSLLLIRIASGGFMLTHGLVKLGMMMNGDFDFPDPIGLGATFSLILTVFSEVICAFLILLGVLSRIAVIPLIITMLVIIFIVHGNDGFGKQELAYFYLISYFIILLCGSGRYSVEGLISK